MGELKLTRDLDNKKFTMEYVANGPIDKVWRAYTDKDTFEKWWGPIGFETTVKEFDFKPGGRVHYAMKCVDEAQTEWYGKTSWGLMGIQEINEGKSFTYNDYFSDEAGAVNTELPALSITNEFIEEDGKTKIVSTCQADSNEQIEQLIKMGMVEGFTSQLQRLDVLID